jgi:hypothetical protein
MFDHILGYVYCLLKKAKAVPLRAMKALWGERRYSSYSYLTSALDGVSCQRHAPGKGPTVPIVQEAGWAPEPVWTEAIGKILCPCRGSNPDRPVVQSVVRHYTV